MHFKEFINLVTALQSPGRGKIRYHFVVADFFVSADKVTVLLSQHTLGQ